MCIATVAEESASQPQLLRLVGGVDISFVEGPGEDGGGQKK
jgi:hypothetical protein